MIRNAYNWMLLPENGDIAVGITMVFATGFLLGLSLVS